MEEDNNVKEFNESNESYTNTLTFAMNINTIGSRFMILYKFDCLCCTLCSCPLCLMFIHSEFCTVDVSVVDSAGSVSALNSGS